MVDIEDRTSALFGRTHTLRVAYTVPMLPSEFARVDLLSALKEQGLELNQAAISAIDRELAALVKASLLRRSGRGRYCRLDTVYWKVAAILLAEWEVRNEGR
jgi:phage terminase large subunit-like protein